MSRSDWTLLLLVISLFGELLGTATVAVNYFTGAEIARELREEVAAEDAEYQQNPVMAMLKDQGPSYIEQLESKKRLRALRQQLAGQLSPKWYLTAGLVLLAIGAVAGFLAALINVV